MSTLQPAKKSPFPSLKSYENAQKLDELINSLKKKSENYNTLHDISGVQKTRKNVRENLTFAMLLGVEEAKERRDLPKIEGFQDDSSQDQVLEYCSKVGTKIESGMWAYFEEQIVS